MMNFLQMSLIVWKIKPLPLLTDDDTAGIAVNVTDNLSGEDGDTATFTMTLFTTNSGCNRGAQLFRYHRRNRCVFCYAFSGKLNLPQVVTVTGVDDVLSDGAKAFLS